MSEGVGFKVKLCSRDEILACLRWKIIKYKPFRNKTAWRWENDGGRIILWRWWRRFNWYLTFNIQYELCFQEIYFQLKFEYLSKEVFEVKGVCNPPGGWWSRNIFRSPARLSNLCITLFFYVISKTSKLNFIILTDSDA